MTLKTGYSSPAIIGMMLNVTYESMFSGSSAMNANAAFFCLVLTQKLPAGRTTVLSIGSVDTVFSTVPSVRASASSRFTSK